MSLQAKFSNEIPEETARVARAIYPKGNLFMKIRDEIGDLFQDQDFADLYPVMGQRSLSPSRLALVLIMQYLSDYSDRQAAEAVRDQISWKYLLGLKLADQGFHYSVLSEFRQRLVEANAQEGLFNPILEKLQEKGLLSGRQKQRSDATHVLAQIRNLNRLELVGEAMRVTLNRLAQIAPDWLEDFMPSDWLDRYAQRFNTWHLPKELSKRQALVLEIGQAAYRLLEQLYQQRQELPLVQIREVEALRQIWIQQFWLNENDAVQLREVGNLPQGAQLIVSPFDLEARFSQESHAKKWLGYKVHLTETCAEDAPRLLTDVQTTAATRADHQQTGLIQAALCAKGLRPEEHYFDGGYASLENLVQSRAQAIAIYSPMRLNTSWQAQTEQGFSSANFFIDWERKQLLCPNGKSSLTWSESQPKTEAPSIAIRFAAEDCQACPVKLPCTKASVRHLKIHPRERHQALEQARSHAASADFKEKYRIRAGVEGTISMAIRHCDLRHSPFIGLQKTALHSLLVASALNILQALNWLNDVPIATTRKSPLKTFAA
jgi:transposase